MKMYNKERFEFAALKIVVFVSQLVFGFLLLLPFLFLFLTLSFGLLVLDADALLVLEPVRTLHAVVRPVRGTAGTRLITGETSEGALRVDAELVRGARPAHNTLVEVRTTVFSVHLVACSALHATFWSWTGADIRTSFVAGGADARVIVTVRRIVASRTIVAQLSNVLFITGALTVTLPGSATFTLSIS